MKHCANFILLSFVLLLTGFSSSLIAEDSAHSTVSVYKIDAENWEQVVPQGKEIDAIIGDLVLKNRYVTAVIAQPTPSRNANMTVKEIAGCLIDFSTSFQSNDQLSAYYPAARNYPLRAWEIVDTKTGLVEFNKKISKHQSDNGIEIRVTAQAAEDRAELTVSYRLEPDSRSLLVTQKYKNKSEQEIPIFINDEIRIDGGKEDQLKSPNGTSHIFWVDDRFWKQAYCITSEKRQIISRSDARRSTLRYGNRGSKPEVVLKPGEEIFHSLHWHVAPDLCDIRAQLSGALKEKKGNVTLTVLASGSRLPIPNARVELKREKEYFGTLWTDGSGRIDQSLPCGNYDAKVSFQGVMLVESFKIRVVEGINTFKILPDVEVGTLKINVTDSQQAPLPCKFQLIGQTEANQLNFGPESAAVTVKNILYLHRGAYDILLPAGKYEAIISRGPEYDALFQNVTIEPDKITVLKGTLKRVVDTDGWISSDFHSHSSPSGDNSGSQFGRVLNLVCEHIEFAPCTEHNRIDSYAPHIETLGIKNHLSTCTGMELTGNPLPLNHQNVFPLIHKPHTQDGGGPLTDTSPEKQIQRAAFWDERSEKLIQQNHPDIGWLFHDKNGDGKPDKGFAEGLPYIEAIELHPLGAILDLTAKHEYKGRSRNNRLVNWLQLLNQGRHITGVVNTDAHYNYHGSGGLRNWIKCSTDLPSEIKTLEIVHATEQAHAIMSNGPFLNVSLIDSDTPEKNAMPGDEVSTKTGKLNLQVRVQCPNWFDIDRVFILINGKHHKIHDYKKKEHPKMFGSQVVKFEHVLPLELEKDAHIIVVAAGENSQLGPVMGPDWGKQQPIAISNPIFVDFADDGYQPNNDLFFDFPPVKNN